MYIYINGTSSVLIIVTITVLTVVPVFAKMEEIFLKECSANSNIFSTLTTI